MPRRIRDSKLENRTSRLKLPVRRKPYTARIAPGVRLGYRRNAEVAGSWSVIVADGHGGNWLKQFAHADDHEEANGVHVLSYWEAQDRGRILARGGDGDNGRPVTVADALDTYAINLAAHDGEPGNVSRVRFHLPSALAAKSVALLSARELLHFRDLLLKKGLQPATVKRTCKPLIAALNAAAAADPRITNRSAWQIGLASLPDADNVRNVVPAEDAIRALVCFAYEDSHAFGLLVETAAVTGARASQLRRLEVRDLVDGPRLMMPSSKKGKGKKRISRSPVPITPALAAALQQAAAGRSDDAPLLLKPDGNPWHPADHSKPFQRIARRAGLDPSEVTLYSLRHASVVRQLLGGTPTRVVAATHDTSIAMIEKNYSKFIANHSDVLVRRNLFDTAQPAASNVVSLPVNRGGDRGQ